jgi:hypothetical protein
VPPAECSTNKRCSIKIAGRHSIPRRGPPCSLGLQHLRSAKCEPGSPGTARTLPEVRNPAFLTRAAHPRPNRHPWRYSSPSLLSLHRTTSRSPPPLRRFLPSALPLNTAATIGARAMPVKEVQEIPGARKRVDQSRRERGFTIGCRAAGEVAQSTNEICSTVAETACWIDCCVCQLSG